jgi:hypothetical protein
VKAKKTIDGDILESSFSDVDTGHASEVASENQYTLTTSIQGEGTVDINPASDAYDEGAPVTITAIPSADYEFDHWEGDISGSDNPLDITVTSDMIVTAIFTMIINPSNDPGSIDLDSPSTSRCFISVLF